MDILELLTQNHNLKVKLTLADDELNQIKKDIIEASYQIVLGLIDHDDERISKGLEMLDNCLD